MKYKSGRNYLKTFRLRTGLTQDEVGELLGYTDGGEVSHHELSKGAPSLEVALAYEIVLRAPISVLFAGLRADIERDIEARLRKLETSLGQRSGNDRDAQLTAHKLVWLSRRSKHISS
jgi:transcriptional regulator with XRE-family HTH domain